MKCCDVEQVLPEVLEGAADAALQRDFETHVKSCAACSGLVSDMKLIAREARQLAASEEPAPQVWLRIAAELRAEGLIREPKPAPTRPILLPTSPRRRWNVRWLVPVAAALLVAGSYVVSHRPTPQVAKQQAPAIPVTSAAPETKAVASASAPTPAPPQLARKTAKPRDMAEPAPSAEDQQFLSEVSTRAPSMRATYESQLQALNADIREVEAYLDQNPGDPDARQHLMEAYQQKALLYQIALDRIQ